MTCKDITPRFSTCLRALAAAAGLAAALPALADTPIYDQMTGIPNTAWLIPSAAVNAGSATGTGNQQMGVPVNLADPNNLTITGFDLTWINATGASVTLDTTHRLKINYWIWNNSFQAATATYANLAGSGSVIFAPTTAVTLANNQFIIFSATQAAAGTLGTAGTAPGVPINPTVTVTSAAAIGLAFNFQIDNATGTFVDVPGSTTMITGGTTAIPPAVGTNAFAGPTFGYYRSPDRATTDNNGNFATSSGRQVGNNSGVVVRVYGSGGAANACCNDITGGCTAATGPSCPSGSTLHAGVACNPSPCPAPQNNTCAGALALPLNGAVVGGSNQTASVQDLPGCAFDLVDGPAVFYKFTGTGNNVTITTCDAGTNLDTIIHVYCSSNGCTGPLNCVGGNDDANPACGAGTGAANASTVTVPTTLGTQYYVVVNGFQGATGNFNIAATDTGTASTNPPTCASLARCVVDNDPFDFAENDACGAGTGNDTNNSCATATLYPALGQIAKGTLATTGTFRDIDIYQLPASSLGANIDVAIQSETPVLVQMLNDASGNCSATFTVVPNSAFGIASCTGITNDLFEVAMPSTGTNFFLITTPSFNGDPCGTGPSSQNDYRVRLSVAVVGACCQPGTICQAATEATCSQVAGFVWSATGACSPTDFCTGVCCTGTTCAASAATDCTATGAVYHGGIACSPTACVTAASGVCCRGATCSTTVTTAAACTGSLIGGQTAGAVFVTTATACNATGNTTTPCCYANYNKVNGISVQDIFDFLGDWFAGSPYARTGGNGAAGTLAVQNIFDFLSAWFAGGCN